MTYFYTQLPILNGSLLTAAKLKVKYTVCLAVILIFYTTASGPGSVVSIATGYGLDGPGIESRWGRDFPHLSRRVLGAHPASCTMGTGSFPGVKSGRGVTLMVRGSNPSGGEIFRTCPNRSWGPPILLYNGHRVFPRVKERPGRDADPSPLLVPWSRKSRAIPILPLWAVRPAQNLRACTRIQFTFPFTLLRTLNRRLE